MRKTTKRKKTPTRSKPARVRRDRKTPKAATHTAKGPTPPVTSRLTTPAEWGAMSPGERVERNRRAATLIRSWMDDDTGYDEEVWPALEQALKEDPIRFREDF